MGEWRAAISGTLLLLGGNGAVAWAEQRVPSGITALLVAVVPLWMVLLDWRRRGGRALATGSSSHSRLSFGLLLFVGAGALSGHRAVSPTGVLVLMIGSFSWARG